MKIKNRFLKLSFGNLYAIFLKVTKVNIVISVPYAWGSEIDVI